MTLKRQKQARVIEGDYKKVEAVTPAVKLKAVTLGMDHLQNGLHRGIFASVTALYSRAPVSNPNKSFGF